ncbi:MAG TPA: hypothetical protein VK437_07295 [Steroidobacteraceae bacterium]|nr:hypothetical protein [Steroidobacteraceae bacterium]
MQLKIFIDLAGWAATLIILASYALISYGRLKAQSALYQWMNIVGAVGFIINCSWNGAWPSVGLNVAWVGIGVVALMRNRGVA